MYEGVYTLTKEGDWVRIKSSFEPDDSVLTGVEGRLVGINLGGDVWGDLALLGYDAVLWIHGKSEFSWGDRILDKFLGIVGGRYVYVNTGDLEPLCLTA